MTLAFRAVLIAMLLDFEVQRTTRRCAATDRPLEPGDECYSVLEVQGADVVRRDYGRDAWTVPPDGAFAWWRSRVPEPTVKKVKLAPNDVLLELFDRLADRPEHEDMRYVLTLLLLRRRVLRLEEASGVGCSVSETVLPDTRRSPPYASTCGDRETMCVYCAKRDTVYEVPVVMPHGERVDEIQSQLSELLVSGANE